MPATGLIFAVTRGAGPAWDPRRDLREQDGWGAHAAFMDALAAEGFVLLAGPLRDGPFHRALLIVRADDEAQVRARLAEDPWPPAVLATLAIDRWEVLIGAPAAPAPPSG